MEHFPLPLQIRLTRNGRHGILLAPFAFVDEGVEIVVPAGFTTDFNSIPRGLWNVFPPWEYPEAGVVHDWLYRTPGEHSRAFSDGVHKRILELLGAPWWKRWAAWAALRAAGWRAWNRIPDRGDPTL